MSYIQFESAREKEKIRQDLRIAREQMLEKAKQSARKRDVQAARKILSGEANWMLPTVSAKIDKLSQTNPSSKSSRKKDKKSKKLKKKKKHTKLVSDRDSDDDSGDEVEHKQPPKNKSKKKLTKRSETESSFDSSPTPKRKQKKLRRKSTSNSESSQEPDAWVENMSSCSKKPSATVQRDSWMTDALMLKTFSRERSEKKPNEKQQIDTYDPAKSTRELNPYWKMTGTGLPTTFRKPKDDSDEEDNAKRNKSATRYSNVSVRNWQKKGTSLSFNNEHNKNNSKACPVLSKRPSSDSSESDAPDNSDHYTSNQDRYTSNVAGTKNLLTDQQMNELGAKIIKAEIMGNTDLAKELKDKLEAARCERDCVKERKIEKGKKSKTEEHVLLTRTDEKGNSRPLQQTKTINQNDLYGGRSGRKKSKQQHVETHEGGMRMRFFPDDDKYDIKQMFEREKYTSAAESNLQFADIASKQKNPNDDLEDIFADKIRKKISQEETDQKELSRAIYEQQKMSAKLENCYRCFESPKMDKKLIVSMGEKAYLALPWHIGLQPGHCVLVPTQHISCCTQLDEDTWEEIINFQKAITKMFAAQKMDVIFFEIANKLHHQPHLSIHCVPIRDKDAELAPFYFKKAIEESEHEWSVNKQLVSLRKKGLRSSIPKGLPYFWVNFGMESGYAHVIEDEDRFPINFAQEIIGGLLQLDPSKWRRPQKEHNIISKVKIFANMWKTYDCTE